MADIIYKYIESEDEIMGKTYDRDKSWHETYTEHIDNEYLKNITLESSQKRAFRKSLKM